MAIPRFKSINLYRDMQKALGGKRQNVNRLGISDVPGDFWTVTARELRKAAEEWEAGRKEQRDKDDLAQAMEMVRAYNAPRPDYDPDEFGTDPRQILTGAKQLDAYQASLGETPTPSVGIDPDTRLAIADPSLKGASPYEPGDEPVGDVAGLEVQKQSLMADAARQQRSFEKENPIGMARVDQDFGGDVEKGPVSRKMLLALMGRKDEDRRAALRRSRVMEDYEKKKSIEAKYREQKIDKYGTPFVVADKNSSTGYSRVQINQAGAKRTLGEAAAPNKLFESAFDKERGKLIAKDMSKIEEIAAGARALTNKFQGIHNLVSTTDLYTGTLGPLVLAVKKAGKSLFGMDISGVAKGEALQKLASSAVAAVKQMMKDPKMSDADRKFYEAMVPNMNTTKGGILLTLEIQRALSEGLSRRGAKLREFMSSNRGSPQKGWDEYNSWVLGNDIFGDRQKFEAIIRKAKTGNNLKVVTPLAGTPLAEPPVDPKVIESILKKYSRPGQ
jgi:hypothetical protein